MVSHSTLAGALGFASGVATCLLIGALYARRRPSSDAQAQAPTKRLQAAHPGRCEAIHGAAAREGLRRLDYVDRLLRWDCGPTLLEMGLFPNCKEITESVACLAAIDMYLDIRFSDTKVLGIVVGDGSTPRTAALLAARSKWNVVSIDPAMRGLPLPGCELYGTGDSVPGKPHGEDCRAEQVAKQEQLSASRDGHMRKRLARIAEVRRLHLEPCTVQQAEVKVAAKKKCARIVIILPHAHVLPDVALGSLHFPDGATQSDLPQISVVQLPCCHIEKHEQVCGQLPDVQYVDDCICGFARAVRIWRDIVPAAVEAGALRLGGRPLLTHFKVAQRVRSSVARAHLNRDSKATRQQP